MSLELENADADWPLVENVKERRQSGTCILANEPDSALSVTINGSGTLGNGGGALVVEPGTGQVQGTEHTIQSGDTRTLDLDLPGGNDRRDVIYLSDAGTLEVRRGRGGSLAWGDGVASSARTVRNAYRPPPDDLVGTPGLVLAVVTVRSGRNSLDSDAVDQIDARPPDGAFHLAAAFTDGEFGYRRLSEFGSLSAALSFSDNNRVPIHADGDYYTDETNISVPRFCWLFGDPHTSRIHATASSNEPLFIYDVTSGTARQTVMDGVRFLNDGSLGAWATYASSSSGFITHDSLFRDLYIRGFGGAYAVELTNAYGVPFDNVAVREYTNGAFHFRGCNASRLSSLTTFIGGDGATPAVYIEDSIGVGLDGYYGEHPTTDAVIQLSGTTSVDITDPYIEQNNGDFDCFVQFGDGGMTAGNTAGQTTPLEECRIEGAKLRNQTATEGMRFYNTRHVSVVDTDMSHDSTGTAFVAGDAGVNAGSVQSPKYGDVHVTGTRPTFMANVADLGSGAAGGGNYFQYEPVDPVYTTTPAANDLVEGEWARGVGTGPNGENELLWKEGGVIHRWTASGTI